VGGQCRLRGDDGRFAVAHLTDHDNIRILTKDGPQSSCERHPALMLHRYLRYAV